MLDSAIEFCGGSLQFCVDWYLRLSLPERIGFFLLVFLGIFIVLRIVHKLLLSME